MVLEHSFNPFSRQQELTNRQLSIFAMKTKSPKFQSPGGSSKSKTRDKESGIAIVTVLSVLMMMTLLVFGFFSAATEELKSSTYYGSSLKTRQLTDVVTNMVIAQIRKATAEQKSEGQNKEEMEAWSRWSNKREWMRHHSMWSQEKGRQRMHTYNSTPHFLTILETPAR